MADGTVIRTGGRNVKDVAGYSLTHLIVGSQGTLGIITEATLRLRPAPPPRSTMLAFFPTLESAGDARRRDRGRRPVAGDAGAAGPVHDRAPSTTCTSSGSTATAAAMLMVESDMPGGAATDELERAEAACRAAGATDVDPRGRRPGGRLAAPGPAGRALRARAARRGADGGRRRAALARAGDAPGDRGDRRQARRPDRDVRACRRRQPASRPRVRARRSARRDGDRSSSRPTCTGRRSRSVARSPASTASASPGASGSRSSAAPTPSRSCARSRRRSTRWASSTRAGARLPGAPAPPLRERHRRLIRTGTPAHSPSTHRGRVATTARD